MGLTSVQVCMDSPDWLQGTINEETGMEMDCSSLTGEMLSCSRPLTERRLRPQHEQALKCPRCDSTHTKFCYYNNYSLSQPRYFCKTCRRYWTKGGTLRNIPVGGGCRKNKKVSSSSKKSNDNNNNIVPQSQHIVPLNHQGGSSSSTDLHLSSFQELQFPHFSSPSFMDIGMLEASPHAHGHTHRPFDFMETKMEGIVGSSHQHYPTNAEHLAMMGALPLPLPDGGLCSSPYGLSLDGAAIGAGLMIPYEHQQPNEDQSSNSNSMDVKPNAKVLALEWQDSQKVESYGYMNGMGSIGMGMGSSWNGMTMSNGYGHGPSTTNPLV